MIVGEGSLLHVPFSDFSMSVPGVSLQSQLQCRQQTLKLEVEAEWCICQGLVFLGGDEMLSIQEILPRL